MYIVGTDSDTGSYFTAVTMTISLPGGTKIFNLLCTYLRPSGIPFSCFYLPFSVADAALFTLISLYVRYYRNYWFYPW